MYKQTSIACSSMHVFYVRYRKNNTFNGCNINIAKKVWGASMHKNKKKYS